MASTRHTGEISSKLSKKVAELTVVVHMLFKRNHEKEVEYEYFKLLVEKEIQKINESYHKQIGWLEKQLEEQESYRAKVEYKLGDAQNLEEKIIALEKQNEETKQQVFAKEDLLKIANLEIGVLKQKLESYEDDLDTMKTNNDFLLKKPQEMDRNSKSATQLQVSKSVHSIDKDSEELERKINFLEDEIERMKSNHENELTKSYAEKIALQQKIDAYNSSLSKEIVSLKETLTTLSSKQANDQKNISELEKKNNKLQESLKKAENDKKTLQKDAKALRDQLKNAIKDGYNKHNLLPIEKAVSQEARIKRYLESVSTFSTVCRVWQFLIRSYAHIIISCPVA